MRLGRAKAVWLTPIFSSEKLRKEVERIEQRSIFIIAAADEEYAAANQSGILGRLEQILVFPGADHTLEVEGDILSTISVLEKIVNVIVKFVAP